MPRCATRFTSARCSSSSQSRSSRYYLLGLAGHEAVPPPPFSWPAAARNRDGWGCNGGTRDLIQINETMPITLSIVVAAIEKRLKCQQRFLGRNAVRPFSRTFWRGVTVASEESLRLHTGASAPPKPAMSLRMTARPAKRLTFRAIPTMPACCFGAWSALQIDRDELASNDPLLFRELRGLCTLCRSKERCVLDLAQEGDEPGNQGWRPQCHDAERSRRRAKLRACGAIPADAAFHRLLGKRVIGRG